MKLKAAENSLFAILLRKPWWISIALAAALSLAVSAMLPKGSTVYGISAGIPFFVIGVIAAFRQRRMPSAARIARTLETVAAMSWPEFSDAVEQAFRRDGYQLARHAGPGANFEMTKAGRMVLLSCKRWKAASTGVEPLRELHVAATARGAGESLYITTGRLTENARRFAAETGIRVMDEVGLAQLLRGIVPVKKI